MLEQYKPEKCLPQRLSRAVKIPLPLNKAVKGGNLWDAMQNIITRSICLFFPWRH